MATRSIIATLDENGIKAIYWDKVLGKKVIRDLEENYILRWNDLA